MGSNPIHVGIAWGSRGYGEPVEAWQILSVFLIGNYFPLRGVHEDFENDERRIDSRYMRNDNDVKPVMSKRRQFKSGDTPPYILGDRLIRTVSCTHYLGTANPSRPTMNKNRNQ